VIQNSAKQVSPKTSTDEGRMISTTPVLRNAHFSIRGNLERDSNINDESDLQLEKHFSHKISTDEGRMIPTKPISLSAYPSIPDTLDSDSN
jgi:hypothetical protein